jgi:hypothetical protein
VQRLDRISRVDDFPYFFGEGEERDHALPVVAPESADRGILWPFRLEFVPLRSASSAVIAL